MNKIFMAIVILCGVAALIFGILPFITEMRFPGAMQILIAIVMGLTAFSQVKHEKKRGKTFWLYLVSAALWLITAFVHIYSSFA